MRRRHLLPCIRDASLEHALLVIFGSRRWISATRVWEKIAFSPRQTWVHPPVADIERKGRRTRFPPSVCDLGIFTSRPKRRVVWVAVIAALCATKSLPMTILGNDRFISYRPGWVLEIPGQAWSVGGLFHWMEEPFILCPDDKNQMLDLIDTLLYDLSDRGAGPLRWPLLFSWFYVDPSAVLFKCCMYLFSLCSFKKCIHNFILSVCIYNCINRYSYYS